MAESQKINASCPVCGTRGLTMSSLSHDVAYFGECLETVIACASCGFRHADFMILSQKEPTRHTFEVRGVDDLGVRVVRANSCTMRLPEVGFVAEPTPRSEAFVSNVQGVIDRIRHVLLTARNIYHDEPETVRAVDEKLEALVRIESGEEPATLVFDDPFGNSAIVSERTEIRGLTPEEVALLETGVVVFDKNDLTGGV